MFTNDSGHLLIPFTAQAQLFGRVPGGPGTQPKDCIWAVNVVPDTQPYLSIKVGRASSWRHGIPAHSCSCLYPYSSWAQAQLSTPTHQSLARLAAGGRYNYCKIYLGDTTERRFVPSSHLEHHFAAMASSPARNSSASTGIYHKELHLGIIQMILS